MKFLKMNISVISKIPNLMKELKIALPQLNFQEINEELETNITNAEIIVGDYDLLAPHIYNLPKTKWVQGTWAGLDAIMPHINKPLPYLLTRFSGQHFGQMMAEYVITNIVNHERDFYAISENQKACNWSQDGNINNYRVISDLTIGIMGIGNIGSWIGKCLNLLGAKVLAYGRRPSVQLTGEYSYISEYFAKPGLPMFLKNSDYIINVLPTTSETRGLLNGNVLQNCKERESVFINVGRGTIIDEKDLIHALNNKWISQAILDVFLVEPLPKDSPLWTMSQVKITPHVAAVSKPKHVAEQFKENYELFINNKPIPTTVNLANEY
ncbi:hypothetical protein ILUMI_11915 [Ignelater luminosus]|uniref:D-isomer specific 2-hydroxyacid dehydrogenase NAD-binding domain-containing protein n=1 Tax=Ignelater luminosus TaxID=2038154 RepID=A0A8K0GCA4_IGNLU|nr:hypothetical protein ILUMI_11915 [Ignelater luminosus]